MRASRKDSEGRLEERKIRKKKVERRKREKEEVWRWRGKGVKNGQRGKGVGRWSKGDVWGMKGRKEKVCWEEGGKGGRRKGS